MEQPAEVIQVNATTIAVELYGHHVYFFYVARRDEAAKMAAAINDAIHDAQTKKGKRSEDLR